MHAPGEITEPDCPSCHRCANQDRAADEDPGGSPPAGWRLGILCLGAFLLPVVLGIAGAVCWSTSDETRFFGAVIGLVVGAAVAVAVGRLLRRGKNGNTA